MTESQVEAWGGRHREGEAWLNGDGKGQTES